MADPQSAGATTQHLDPTGAGPIALKDVWSRSGSKYRIRAVVLLAVNVLLFAGVCGFAYWLRTGEYFAPGRTGYVDELSHTFRSVGIVGHRGVSLGDLLLKPISIQDVPMQIPILGLLMAALISIPVLVAILYRFWSSLPFVSAVGLLAAMPWLAITLLASCIIASARPLRTRFRFTSALLGLAPVVLYLVLAGSGTADAVVGRIDPVDRIKFIAPWVLAVVAATLVFAIVLSIARIVDYRPGAITPLLAIMFGLPVALFEFHVGRDELYYRLLQARNEAHFTDVDASDDLERALRDEWTRRSPARRSMQAVRETAEIRWLFELMSDVGHERAALAQYQAELVDDCDWFLRYFPHSRHASSALFIKARALDMRVDPAEFRRTKWIRFYDDFPSPASHQTWRMLLENQPETLLGATALLRLAQIEAREGDVDRARRKLATLLARFGGHANAAERAAPDDGPLESVLTPDSPESGLEVHRERILLEAHRLAGLLGANRDPLYGYDPLCGPHGMRVAFAYGLLDLEPRHDRYIENLEALKAHYPNCQIADNIDLEIAKAMGSLTKKIERLERCLDAYPTRDAAPEALFRLGMAYKRNDQPAKSEITFGRLFAEFSDSAWATLATRHGSPTPRVLLSRAR